jgi:hypothetical protein
MSELPELMGFIVFWGTFILLGHLKQRKDYNKQRKLKNGRITNGYGSFPAI